MSSFFTKEADDKIFIWEDIEDMKVDNLHNISVDNGLNTRIYVSLSFKLEVDNAPVYFISPISK